MVSNLLWNRLPFSPLLLPQCYCKICKWITHISSKQALYVFKFFINLTFLHVREIMKMCIVLHNQLNLIDLNYYCHLFDIILLSGLLGLFGTVLLCSQFHETPWWRMARTWHHYWETSTVHCAVQWTWWIAVLLILLHYPLCLWEVFSDDLPFSKGAVACPPCTMNSSRKLWPEVYLPNQSLTLCYWHGVKCWETVCESYGKSANCIY